MGQSLCSFDHIIDYGHIKSQGLYDLHVEYDAQLVKNLIRKGQLAPFYQGFNQITIQKDLNYENECPICFLYYPSKVNTTRCCQKLICTECFLQLRRNSPSQPITCPFCVQPNFGIIYIPPAWSKFKSTSIDVILADSIRSDWDTTQKSSSEGSTRRRRVLLNQVHATTNTTPDIDTDILVLDSIFHCNKTTTTTS